MAIDEKYLDDLLKSITENEEEPRTMDDAMREMASASDAEDEDGGEEEDDFFTGEQDLDYDHTAILEDYLEKALPEAEPVPEEDEVDLEEMELLKEITAAGLSYEQVSLEPSSEEDELDLAEMINQADAGDDALEEINGLLNKVDEGATVDEDILALLENMENNGEGDEIEDPFKLLESEAVENMPVQESKPEEKAAPKEKKAKKKKSKKEKPEKPEKTEKSEKADKKFRILGKKKHGDEKEQPEESQSDEEMLKITNEEIAVEPKEIDVEEIESGIGSYEEMEAPEDTKKKDMSAKENTKEKKQTKEKKPGFFSKLLAAFAEEDDFDDVSEENKKLLKEIGDEEKKAKKANKKKEKSAAKKPKKEKPKKPKAPKKPKEKKAEKPKVNEKPVKPLGKKTWFIAIAFGGTVLASIMLLNAFLPEYADKKAAQKAFYLGDYETAYTLWYDKRLSEDETLLFNKAKTICTMERRIRSHENNLALNREVEAVDALLKGVDCYQSLTEADQYGVRGEVDALYAQICSILENDYGIAEEEALEINTYDSEAYTRKIHEILYGSTPAGADEGETQEPEAVAEPLPPEDLLPEEETLID